MSSTARRFLVPEVLQSSLMDCGPATLTAMLEGYGIAASYDALRERCQTDIDGTSIDALAQLAREQGLEVQHCVVARDHLLLPESRCLPAIVITQPGAAGELHFCVVWRRLGSWVQVMDPASGRRWVSHAQFLASLPALRVQISRAQFGRWCESEHARAPLFSRMRALGIGQSACRSLLEFAADEDAPRAFSRLDAAVRMLASLVESGALRRGKPALHMLRSLRAAATSRDNVIPWPVPERYVWASFQDGSDLVSVRGAVIVHCRRSRLQEPSPNHAADRVEAARVSSLQAALPASVLPLLAAGRPAVTRILFHTALAGSRVSLLLTLLCLLTSACLVPVEGLILQSYLHAERFLGLQYQRAFGIAALLVWASVTLGLELYTASAGRSFGRELEARLRVAWLLKLPRLEDRYLQSRSSSDMAARGHSLHLLGELPSLALQALRAAATLVATALGLLWLHPEGAALSLGLIVAGLSAPLLLRRSVVETATRLRTHQTTLERFVLDALLAVSPIRVHGAQDAVRRQHEAMLLEWGRTANTMHTQSVGLQGLARGLTSLFAIALIVSFAWRGPQQLAGLLLCGFWALRIPELAQALSAAVLSLRSLRGLSLRLVAPLAANELVEPARDSSAAPRGRPSVGIGVAFEQVSAVAGGHTLLSELSLRIAPGEHVAIIGESGAGKSSLFGLLLGFVKPSAGQIRVDGQTLDDAALLRLREQLAWVDPNTRLWDCTLADNLLFTTTDHGGTRLADAFAKAELHEIIAQLSQGAQSALGEAGCRVSGGQGQRIRVGRAFMRSEARLMLLDEPFRGLERARRKALLAHMRANWQAASVLYVTHDIEDALDFPRVLILEHGRLVEDGDPRVLAADSSSRFAQLRAAAERLHAQLWDGPNWRRLQLRAGTIAEPSS